MSASRNVPSTLVEMSIAFTKQVVAEAEECKMAKIEVRLLRERVSLLEKCQERWMESHVTIAYLQEQLANMRSVHANLMSNCEQTVRIKELENEVLDLQKCLSLGTPSFEAFSELPRHNSSYRLAAKLKKRLVRHQLNMNSNSLLDHVDEDYLLAGLFNLS